ncbi:hypothetical protein, partial [Suttonella ornithocola]|uniref:hypothetical protein n=1 Tax=Suttonella ornithocola TaxID=279832 RepID=UPI001B808484
ANPHSAIIQTIIFDHKTLFSPLFNNRIKNKYLQQAKKQKVNQQKTFKTLVASASNRIKFEFPAA